MAELFHLLQPSRNHCENIHLDLTHTPGTANGTTVFNTSFFIYVANEHEEGLYSLYFHNCHNYRSSSHVSGRKRTLFGNYVILFHGYSIPLATFLTEL